MTAICRDCGKAVVLKRGSWWHVDTATHPAFPVRRVAPETEAEKREAYGR